MADRVTTVDVKMEPSKVISIAERWTAETGFSVHEKTGQRVIYCHPRRISGTEWLSIENLGSHTKLSAWVAPGSLGPDEIGSFWKGNKIPLPIGFALGPLGRFKRQFNMFLGMIRNESSDTSVVTQGGKTFQTPWSRESFAKVFIWMGVFVLLYGGLSLYNGTSPLARQLFPATAEEFVRDGLTNLFMGVVFVTCAMLLKKGKAISIWLYGGTMLFSAGLNLARGADFPFFPILFGVWVTSQLLGLKKQGQLA